MKYEKTIVLKNGVKCLIRNAIEADAKEVYDNYNLTHSETDFLLSYTDEDSYDVEQERQFLIEKEISTTEIELCAIVEGRIVGTAGIEAVGKKYKIKHRAELGISVEKSYWGLGIGSVLLEACIECAKKAGYIQIELSVVADNISALSLYTKAGFVEYGRNPKGFCSRVNGWQEIILMQLLLNL
ncbi:MAG: GNAT family N-acetyltransferase [Oscillospiraceae bacterium]